MDKLIRLKSFSSGNTFIFVTPPLYFFISSSVQKMASYSLKSTLLSFESIKLISDIWFGNQLKILCFSSIVSDFLKLVKISILLDFPPRFKFSSP